MRPSRRRSGSGRHMPNTNEPPESTTETRTDGAPEGAEQPANETPPQYVTRAEFDSLRGLIETSQASLNESLRALAANRAAGNAPSPVVTEQPIEDVSDEEIQRAQEEGRPIGPLMRKAAAAAAERARRSMAAEVAPVRATGEKSLTAIAKRLARQDMPFYEDVKAELDPVLATLPPASQADPDQLVAAYDYVSGLIRRTQPERWQKIEERERAKALRQAGGTAGTQTPGNAGSGREVSRETAGKLTPETVFSTDTLGHLKEIGKRGKSFEEFVESLPPRADGTRWTPEEYLRETVESGNA